MSVNATRLPGKSWTAYIAIGVFALLLLLIVVPLARHASTTVGVVSLLIAGFFITYRVLVIHSFTLYYDDAGVWVYSGVFPWNRGVGGVKWRDLDEAVYFQTFWSWLFKSYSVRIGHRFTKSNEIFLTHMAQGNQSVKVINSRHQDLVRANALP